MKAILAGILGSVCLLNLLMFTVRAHSKPVSSARDQIAALQERVERLEARECRSADCQPFISRTFDGSCGVPAEYNDPYIQRALAGP